MCPVKYFLLVLIITESSLRAAGTDHVPALSLDGVKSEARLPRYNMRVNVTMTLVPVSVYDQLGRNVLGLQRENFSLLDEQKPQKIISFSLQDAPVSVGIVLDSSGSMSKHLQMAHRAAAELFRQLNPEDEAFLVDVSNNAVVRVGLTSDFAKVTDAILFDGAAGSTALVDGVYLAVNRLQRAHHRRRALIVISDGQDNNSRYTERELRSLAIEAGAQIYTVGLFNSLPQTNLQSGRVGPVGSSLSGVVLRPEENILLNAEGRSLMYEIAEWTGGRAFEIQGPGELPDVMARIGITLHSEYVLGYYPPEDVPPGKFRRIHVILRTPAAVRQLSIAARRGYYAPE